MRNLFLDHPRDAGETYLQHLRFAAGVGVTMCLGGLACLAHALLPFLFRRTGTRCLQSLNHRLAERSRATR